MNMANVLTPFVLFPVQSASSFGHNARIAPSLTGTLSSKIEQNLTRIIFRTTQYLITQTGLLRVSPACIVIYLIIIMPQQRRHLWRLGIG